ncbi:MAG: TolB family protein [Gaiellaceae bacterium]
MPSRLPRYIAYDPPGGGIWLVKPDGTDAHQVGPPDGTNPVWSSDAKKILYQAPAPPNSQGGVTEDAYVMNADGTDQHPIMPSAVSSGDWIADWNDVDFQWSPDGKQIVFTQWSAIGLSDVWIANADGSDPHGVPIDVFGGGASFSPDGSHLVFGAYVYPSPHVPNRPLTGIYAVRPDGKGLRRIVVGGYDSSWSPDGRNIIYFCLRDQTGFHGICERFRKPGSQRFLYADRYKTLLNLSWNANGSKILVTVERGQNGVGRIALMSPSGVRLVKIGVSVAAGTYPDW